MRIAFTDRELDVMSVLWDLGDATVAEVRERLADELAYTTVLTVLRTLEQEGYVAHTGEGRAHRYNPLVQRVIAMGATFTGVRDVPLLLEGSQNRQDGGVCELIGESLTYFGDGSVAEVPEHAHDIQLAIGEGNPHAPLLLLVL